VARAASRPPGAALVQQTRLAAAGRRAAKLGEGGQRGSDDQRREAGADRPAEA
jgi:hypothetical protein